MANDRAESGATPAYFAAQNGHLKCLQYLVKAAGANVHLRANDGMQPIHAAAQTGQLHCVIWLVQQQGVLVMERDNDGATPLHFAASRGHSGVVCWLLENGAVCEKDHLGGTPLHDAAEHGQLECAKILVEHGCDVNSEDKDFLVASDLAKKCNHFKVAKFLRRIEKSSGNAKGKGHSSRHIPTDHEAGVYIKRSVSSPTNTSSLSSSIMSDQDSSSSIGTIEVELVDEVSGRYEVTESPDANLNPPYIQIYGKLTEVDPTRKANGLHSSPRTRSSLKKRKSRDATEENHIPTNMTEVCSQGTQTDPHQEMNNGDVNGARKSGELALTAPPPVSPKKCLRRQSAIEKSYNSPSKEAWLPDTKDTKLMSPAKLSPEKKELRFSTTVMVEEIARQEDSVTSPSKRNIQLIPLNSSSEANLQSPTPRKPSYMDFVPFLPQLTNSPPPYVQTVTPNRPTTIVIPPPPSQLFLPTSAHPPKNGLEQHSKPNVSSQMAFITSTVSIPPSPPPPPPPLLTNGLPHGNPTTNLPFHLQPHLPGPPSPSELANVVLKPSPQKSRRSPSSSTGGKQGGFNADLIAEIQAGAAFRQARQNQSVILRTNKDPPSRASSPDQDKGPKVYYAADFLNSVPLEDEVELPDWKRRFLAKKEADRANQQAEVEYKQDKKQKAEERKYRDMPAWKVELLKKKDTSQNPESIGVKE